MADSYRKQRSQLNEDQSSDKDSQDKSIESLQERQSHSKMNGHVKEIRIRPHRNAQLVEDLLDTGSFDGSRNQSYNFDESFNECLVSAEIRTVNGGMCYSNPSIEKNWKKQTQKLINGSLKTENNCKPNNQEPSTKASNSSKRSRRARGSRNVAMKSLIEQHHRQEDIGVDCSGKRGTPEHFATGQNSLTDNTAARFPFVENSNDPDFYYRQIQLSDCEDIDFTIAHVGKIHTVKPREYLIMNTKDSDFEFKREN